MTPRKILWALQDWRQAFFERAKVAAKRKRGAAPTPEELFPRVFRAPVAVLLPGIWEPWEMLIPWGRALSEAGYEVRMVPALDRQFGAIEDLAETLDDFLAEQELENVVVVAHSKGGLVAKQSMLGPQKHRIAKLVAVGTPFEGAPIVKWAPKFLRVDSLAPSSPEITRLVEQGDADPRTISVQAKWDQSVPRTYVSGGKNLVVPVVGHNALLRHPKAVSAVVQCVLHH